LGRHWFGLPFRHSAVLLATWFGVGFLPFAPGSWAALTVLPCGWVIRGRFGVAVLAMAAVIAFVAGW
jgi:phosphatidylglycerophosphatase A